jgi:hypothetical protein
VTLEDRLTDLIIEWFRSDSHPAPAELADDLIAAGWVLGGWVPDEPERT